MGNQLAAPARVQPGELLASDVPTLVYKDSLGGGRFLKTFLTRAEEGTSCTARNFHGEPCVTLRISAHPIRPGLSAAIGARHVAMRGNCRFRHVYHHVTHRHVTHR